MLFDWPDRKEPGTEPGKERERARKHKGNRKKEGEIPASSEQLFVMGVYTSVVVLERQRDISKSHEDVKLPNKMVKYVI